MSDRQKFLIVVAVVLAGIVIGAIFPFAVDNTKRMRDAEKAAEPTSQEPATKP
jgi:hypothetical protein